MLEHLQLQNFAIAEQIDLDLQAGLSVITGETGAGKSILINALKLALGDRALGDFIKNGEQRASISISFAIEELPDAQTWLKQNDFDEQYDCDIRRVLTQDGRSKSYINGNACTLQDLKHLGKHLISIHGQHEGQLLLQTNTQQHLLDAFGKNLSLSQQVKELYNNWHRTKREYEKLLNNSQNAAKQSEFLRFQIEEIEALNLNADLIDELDEEQKTLANADQILSTSNQIYDFLQGDQGVNEKLNLSLQSLQNIPIKNKGVLIDAINQAMIQSEEVANELQSLVNNFEADPNRLQDIENLLTKLHDIARKHRVKPNQLYTLLEDFKLELAAIDNNGQNIATLELEIEKLERLYKTTASKLSAQRKKSATQLSKKISTLIQTLGMPKGEFIVALNKLDAASADGLERIQFMINLNPGQAAAPLSKIASGGELSRISLAIHVCTAECEQTPTLIFDEVDAGISGEVASTVAKLLKQLALSTQIICITHLAQVAARGDQHLQVAKTVKDGKTKSNIQTLSRQQRIDELAKMTSGKQNDAKAKVLVESMLAENQL